MPRDCIQDLGLNCIHSEGKCYESVSQELINDVKPPPDFRKPCLWPNLAGSFNVFPKGGGRSCVLALGQGEGNPWRLADPSNQYFST